jgi:hypothetical protein
VSETLLNPAADAWGALRWTTLEYESELRGSAVWDVQRGHLVQASTLSGSVRETRVLPNGRKSVRIEEQVELVVQAHAASWRRRMKAATTQPANVGRDPIDRAQRRDAGAIGMTAGRASPTRSATPRDVSADAPLGADGSPVLAKLGEVEITEAQIARQLLEGLKGKAWPQGERLETLKRALLSQTIVQHVFEAWGANRIRSWSRRRRSTRPSPSRKSSTPSAAGISIRRCLAVGMTREDVRAGLLAQLAKRKLEERSADRNRAKAFYEQHKDAFDGTRVLVEHLAIRVDPLLAGEAEHLAVRERLLKVRQQILAGKTDASPRPSPSTTRSRAPTCRR